MGAQVGSKKYLLPIVISVNFVWIIQTYILKLPGKSTNSEMDVPQIRIQTQRARLFFDGNSTGISSVPYASYHFPAEDANNTFDGFSPLIFITTHMSKAHIWYLRACWPPAMRHSELLAKSDVMVYLTSSTGEKDQINVLRDTFWNQHLTIHLKENPGYAEGAMAAMKDAILEKWFDGYDWIVRLNPDVIIRNDTFLLNTMKNDRNATGVLIDCDARKPLSMINTDFFAIKPSALGEDAFMDVSMEGGQTVEGHFAKDVRKSIIDKGNHRWVPGSQPAWHTCRAGFGREMETADVVHMHVGTDLSRPWAKMPEPDEKNMKCQVPF